MVKPFRLSIYHAAAPPPMNRPNAILLMTRGNPFAKRTQHYNITNLKPSTHEFVIYSLPIFRLRCRNIRMNSRLCIAMIICIFGRTERTAGYTQLQPISRDYTKSLKSVVGRRL